MPDYTEGNPGPGKSAQVDAIAHSAAAQVKTIGTPAAAASTVGDTNHDPNETPQGNPGRQGSAQ